MHPGYTEVRQELRRPAGNGFGGAHLPLGEHGVPGRLLAKPDVGEREAVQQPLARRVRSTQAHPGGPGTALGGSQDRPGPAHVRAAEQQPGLGQLDVRGDAVQGHVRRAEAGPEQVDCPHRAS